MIRLIKTKRTYEKQLLSGDGRIELCDAGIMIHFPGKDKRHPIHTVLIDRDDIKKLCSPED